MKLYVWNDVLIDYDSGIVCVYAATEADAIEALKTHDDGNAYRVILRENEGKLPKPQEFDKTHVVVQWGNG